MVVLSFVWKSPKWNNASCLQRASPFVEQMSLHFNEIKDVVDVHQTETHIQIAVWFPKTKACESSFIPQENKLIDGTMRASSCVQPEAFYLDFFFPPPLSKSVWSGEVQISELLMK